MRIGELAVRAQVSTRVLRYYEQQGLLAPARSGNTYREYTDDDVARAEQVAAMVRSGLPTRVIKALLELEETERRDATAACPREVADLLATELAEIESRIACLSRSRDTIERALRRTESAVAARSGTGS